jgi:hypothetical protein
MSDLFDGYLSFFLTSDILQRLKYSSISEVIVYVPKVQCLCQNMCCLSKQEQLDKIIAGSEEQKLCYDGVSACQQECCKKEEEEEKNVGSLDISEKCDCCCSDESYLTNDDGNLNSPLKGYFFTLFRTSSNTYPSVFRTTCPLGTRRVSTNATL